MEERTGDSTRGILHTSSFSQPVSWILIFLDLISSTLKQSSKKKEIFFNHSPD